MARSAARRKIRRRTRNAPQRKRLSSSNPLIPRLVSVPNDPRPVSYSRQSTVTVSIVLVYTASSSTEGWYYGDLFTPARLEVGSSAVKHPTQIILNATEIRDLINAKLGLNTSYTAQYLDFALRRINVWGPTVTTVPGATVGLAINMGLGTTTKTAVDTGTATQRPKLGMVVPPRWFHATETNSIVEIWYDRRDAATVAWPTTRTDLGEIRLTCGVNLSDTPLTSHK